MFSVLFYSLSAYALLLIYMFFIGENKPFISMLVIFTDRGLALTVEAAKLPQLWIVHFR